MHASIVLKPGKERPVLRRHPWVYSNAIDRFEGKVYPGSTVYVISHDGKFLAKGLYSPSSQIRVRILTWDEKKVLTMHFLRGAFQKR